jgi:hypothetical protein
VRALAVLPLLALAGCLGSIRDSTTPRTATEQLLCSTAAQRAVSHVDSAVFAGKKVFVDVAPLVVQVEKGYIVDAFEQLVAEAGGKLAPRDKADLVVEVRAAALGCWDGKWLIWIPVPYAAGMPTPDPWLIEIGYALKEGWCRVDAFCYDPATGFYVCGWRSSWGRAYVGIFDDIYPEITIATNLRGRVQ